MKPNKDKIILDLCGGTGLWSKPYKEAGYDVRLITLPENDVRDYIPPKMFMVFSKDHLVTNLVLLKQQENQGI